MKSPIQIKIPPISDHFSEIALLGLIAFGVVLILLRVIDKGITGWDVAACLLVLQGIISAIKERWTQRSVDRMGQSLANSPPAGSGGVQDVKVTNAPSDPIPVVDKKERG